MDSNTKFRQHSGLLGMMTKVLFVTIPVIGLLYLLDIPFYLGIGVHIQQYVALFMSLNLAGVFIIMPATKNVYRDKLPLYDILLALASVVVGGYIFILYPRLVIRMGEITPINIILSVTSLVVILEATRRLLGWTLVILATLFIIYPFLSYLAPGVLQTRKLPWDRVLNFLYLDSASLLGLPLVIAATIILAFIFFGRFLFMVGGGQFLTNLALATLGKYRGGPAKVSILASAFFATLSGSASANVVTTGVITIPLMKKVGYNPRFAAAIEAVASTAGTITPPVMAAAAFLIAEFLALPYAKVCLAAMIPAILYYISVYLQVDLEAAKNGLEGLPSEEIPSLRIVLQQGWIFVVPILVLIYSLFFLYLPPALSAIYATFALFLLCCFKKENRKRLGQLLHVLDETGRGLLEISVICMVAGLVIGSISITGLGLTLSRSLIQLSGGNVSLLLVTAALASIILGMGMPITAIYIVVSILVAPALIQSGIVPLAAHLFILYFGAMSFITPPVCIAAYVSASIAGSKPLQTGFLSMRLAISAFVVPFVFATAPALIFEASLTDFFLIFVKTVIGIAMVAIALEGYLFNRLSNLRRAFGAIAGLAVLVPHLLIVNGIGLILTVFFFLWPTAYFKRIETS